MINGYGSEQAGLGVSIAIAFGIFIGACYALFYGSALVAILLFGLYPFGVCQLLGWWIYYRFRGEGDKNSAWTAYLNMSVLGVIISVILVMVLLLYYFLIVN